LSRSYSVLRTLRAKMKKTNKSVHVTFRLTEDEYAPFAKAIAQLDISKSEFFRMLTLNRIENYQPDYRQQPDYKRCLFLMNKTSNNLNQIAHRLNLDHNKGIISSSLYERALNTLINIRDLLQGALK
ncbi:TPA: plasmid mobilization protein, partial [Escherichia coli]